MTYRFTREDKNTTFALRRIAADELDESLRILASEDRGLPESIHGVRKSIKKLRGLLRLVKPGFAAFRAENAALRDAARRLSELRDTDVLFQTLDMLGEDRHRYPILSDAIRQSRDARRDDSTALAECKTALEAIRRRTGNWTLDHDGFRDLRRGLRRTHRAAQLAMRRLGDAPQDEQVHDWRKRVKDSQYQMVLLAPLWPEIIRPRAAATDRLGESLGLHHDLSVLSAALAGLALPAKESSAIRARIAAEQGKIMHDALPLGARLFAGDAAAIADLWADWWTIWRDKRA